MVLPMADEFYEKYKHLSHQELYRMLQAGSPRQVDGVGDNWASIASTLDGLAGSLRQDMDRLLAGFAGSASQEVLDGLSALARHAKTIAEDAAAMRSGLTAMAQALAAAQRQAEAPQEVPANPVQAVTSVLGAEVGHLPTPEELARARERMIWLVARLAAQYGIAEHTNWPGAAVLPSAIVSGATAVLHEHGHGEGHRHGTGLQSAGEFVRHLFQPSHVSPLLSQHGVLQHGVSQHGVLQHGVQPGGLTSTTAEALGALRGVSAAHTQSVHIVGGTSSVPISATDSGGSSGSGGAGGGSGSGATSGGPAGAPPPPVGLGGAGMTPGGSVLGGGGSSPGLGAPGALGPGGLHHDVSWQMSDNVEWIDPDDATPSVIGG